MSTQPKNYNLQLHHFGFDIFRLRVPVSDYSSEQKAWKLEKKATRVFLGFEDPWDVFTFFSSWVVRWGLLCVNIPQLFQNWRSTNKIKQTKQTHSENMWCALKHNATTCLFISNQNYNLFLILNKCCECQSKIDKNEQCVWGCFSSRTGRNAIILYQAIYLIAFLLFNKEMSEFLTLPDVKKLAGHNQDQRDIHTFL